MNDEQTPANTLRDSVMEMAHLMGEVEIEFGVPPEVTMDIIRLHMMYMGTPTLNAEIEEAASDE